jgi:hypothetical protein
MFKFRKENLRIGGLGGLEMMGKLGGRTEGRIKENVGVLQGSLKLKEEISRLGNW